MKAADFRPLFERFQNLNLIRLIHDLEDGRVHQGEWYLIDGLPPLEEVTAMCPLAHGLDRDAGDNAYDRALSIFGVEYSNGGDNIVNQFTEWWDGAKRRSFLPMLRLILAERLADADAVQEVIAPRMPELSAASAPAHSAVLQESPA